MGFHRVGKKFSVYPPMWLWAIPDAAYDVIVDFSKYHPAVFTDILFGAEFNEAIYHGVLKALYEGQFKRQLKLAEQTFDTFNHGINAGRACWLVAGTFCDNKVSGTFAEKIDTCRNCDFYVAH